MQEYIKTDRQLHWLSQLITKVNRTFVPEQKDDSHTNLYFDVLGKRILGRWIKSPGGKIMLTLNLHSLHFEWLDAKQNVLHKVSVFNKNMAEIEKSAVEYLLALKMNTENFYKPLHFEIPDYKIVKLTDMDISNEGLKSWMFFRDLANNACQAMLGYLQSESDIRLWPHHFDTGIYTQANENMGLGFGLAMEDSMVGQPYFYLSGYKSESQISYKNLNTLSAGRWITGENWNGAVLPLSKISDFSYKKADDTIKTFIREATGWFLNQ